MNEVGTQSYGLNSKGFVNPNQTGGFSNKPVHVRSIESKPMTSDKAGGSQYLQDQLKLPKI